MSTLSVTVDELKEAGLAYKIEHGGKHIKVRANGLPLIVCSVSCSTRFGELKARSLVRRLIKQNRLGAVA